MNYEFWYRFLVISWKLLLTIMALLVFALVAWTITVNLTALSLIPACGLLVWGLWKFWRL